MKNNFEQLIKNSLENHEVPYEAGAWEKFNQAQAPTPFYKSKWFVGGAALIAIIASITLYNVKFDSTKELDKNEANQIAESTNNFEVIENKTSETKNVKINVSTSQVSSTQKSSKDESSPNKKNDIGWTVYPPEQNSSIDKNNNIKIDNKSTNNTDTPNTKVDPPKKEDLITNDSKPVLDLTPPSASFYIEKTICEGNEITLIADNADDNYDYSWKLNDEEIVSGKIVSITAKNIGENIATLFISQDGLQIDKKKSTFKVIETPINNAKIELNQASLINELEFGIDVASNQIVWNFGDGTTSTENQVNHTYKQAGKYKCEYTITAINGCSASFERNINVKGYYNLRTDYGFSPNDGNNINDVFIPVELKELNVPFTLSIFARNGQELYTTSVIDKPWMGKMQDGSDCTFGSYVWKLNLTNELGIEETYIGTVTNVNN